MGAAASSSLANHNQETKCDQLNNQTEDSAQDPLPLELKEDHETHHILNAESSSHQQRVESLIWIEAELEAELERLESNINSSRQEEKPSLVVELDQSDFESDVVKGDLRANLFGAKSSRKTCADRDGSGNTTPHSLAYPVSPVELSLKLHEVIRLRLEERIKELETALQSSQRKLKIVESSYIHDSPVARVRRKQIIDQPGEAIFGYSESYNEPAKDSESDDEDLKLLSENDESRVQKLNGNSRTLMNDNVSSSMEESNDDDDDDDEDGMEKILIRQIIEKAKQGSPAVLKAQRAFLLTGEGNTGRKVRMELFT